MGARARTLSHGPACVGHLPKVEIISNENGPNLVLVDGKATAAFYRCGRSKNKTDCDGSPRTAGFTAPRAVGNVVPKPGFG